MLESEQLSEHLERLDDFEGPGYARALTEVTTSAGKVEAFIYVLAQ